MKIDSSELKEFLGEKRGLLKGKSILMFAKLTRDTEEENLPLSDRKIQISLETFLYLIDGIFDCISNHIESIGMESKD